MRGCVKKYDLYYALLTIVYLLYSPMATATHEDADDLMCGTYGREAEDEDLKERVKKAVWAVEQKDDQDNFNIRGTATLIEEHGFLITAAHVVKDVPVKDLYLRKLDQPKKLLKVSKIIDIGKPGDTPESVSDDWAILHVDKWTGFKHPVLLRETGDPKGRFFAINVTPHEQNKDITYQLEPHWYESLGKDNRGILLIRASDSNVFKRMSGALLVDKYGYGFGLIGAKLTTNAAYSPNDVEEPDKIKYVEGKFGIAKIRLEDTWLTKILEQMPADWEFKQELDNIKQGSPWNDFKDNHPGLDLLQLKAVYNACDDIEFRSWSKGDQKDFLNYVIRNSVHRCVDSEKIVLSNCIRMATAGESIATAGEKIEIGRKNINKAIEKTAKNEEQEKLVSLVLAEALINSGISELEEQNDVVLTSKYRANIYADLAKVQSAIGDNSALIRSTETLAKARDLGLSKSVALDVARKIAINSEEWESAAAIIAKQSHLQGSFEKLKPEEIQARNIRLSELARLASEKDSDWGRKATRKELLDLAKGKLDSVTIEPVIHDELNQALRSRSSRVILNKRH